jgi:hypothetical protein
MSWSSSESEQDEECNEFIRHFRGSVICFNLRSFKRYSKICNDTTENLSSIDNISERFSGGAMVLRINTDGTSAKGQSKPWMTVHQNSCLLLNSPIVFDEVSINKNDKCRVLLFVKNYANRENSPIKRFCALKFHSTFDAEVFVETYKKVIQEIVEKPRLADVNFHPDALSTSHDDEVESFQGVQNIEDEPSKLPGSLLDLSRLNLGNQHEEDDGSACDYYNDEDFDDLCENTQDPYASSAAWNSYSSRF